jgi:hypothetical protein
MTGTLQKLGGCRLTGLEKRDEHCETLEAPVPIAVADLEPFITQVVALKISPHLEERLLNSCHHQAILTQTAEIISVRANLAVPALFESRIVGDALPVLSGCYRESPIFFSRDQPRIVVEGSGHHGVKFVVPVPDYLFGFGGSMVLPVFADGPDNVVGIVDTFESDAGNWAQLALQSVVCDDGLGFRA